jgi:hypothetical protein
MAYKKNITPSLKALETWVLLNDALRNANEATCHALIKAEMGGRNRKQFVMRIHSRLNKVRADRERKEFKFT